MHCTRSPPISRKHRFVQEIIRLAEDDRYGYSQRPPSGRWGPDYDCTSLIYQAAHNVGYNVGVGGDKIRFSGTMLKDFEKAGFQVLPFANVGVSDLKIGDILLNLALHAEVYVGDDNSVGIETPMISTTAAAGDVNNVSKRTAVQTCCCGPETCTVVNTGETSVVVENPLLFIKRVA